MQDDDTMYTQEEINKLPKHYHKHMRRQRDKRITELYVLEHVSVPELAKRFDLSTNSIPRIICQYRKSLRVGSNEYQKLVGDCVYKKYQSKEAREKRQNEVMEMYLVERKSIDEIAEALELSPNSIPKMVSLYRQKLVPGTEEYERYRGKVCRKPHNTDLNKLKQLYDEGNTLQAIANQLGCSRTTVHYWIHKLYKLETCAKRK